MCVYLFVCLFVLSFRSKFLVTKPLPRQLCYCPRGLFMMWSGIPAAISVDSATVMEDDWTSKVSVTRTSIGPNLIYESCGQYPELSTTVLCLSLGNFYFYTKKY